MAYLTKPVHKLRSDEAGTSYDDDFHDPSPVRVGRIHRDRARQECAESGAKDLVVGLKRAWIYLGFWSNSAARHRLLFTQPDVVRLLRATLRLGHGALMQFAFEDF